MAYINSDGQIQQHRPWSVGRVLDIVWGTVNFFTFFFRSLFHLDDPSPRGQYGQRSQRQTAPRRGIGGVGRVSGIAPPPPACFGGG